MRTVFAASLRFRQSYPLRSFLCPKLLLLSPALCSSVYRIPLYTNRVSPSENLNADTPRPLPTCTRSLLCSARG